MSRIPQLRWFWVLFLLLGLSSLACITAEFGVSVVPGEGAQGELNGRIAVHLTDSYIQAARQANIDLASDYQQAGLDPPDTLFPETLQEIDPELSPESLLGDDQVTVLEQSDKGFTIAASGQYDELDLADEASGQYQLTVNRDDPNVVRYAISIDIEDMSQDFDLAGLDELRSQGLGPKPPVSVSSGDDEPPAESDAGDIGTYLAEEILGGVLGAVSDLNMDLEAWYAQRVLLAAEMPSFTYWVELPGKVVSYELNGRNTGTLDPSNNRVTLVVDESFMRQHPDSLSGTWRIVSELHVCQEQCEAAPHMEWDGVSSAGACACQCETGWIKNAAGDACIEAPPKDPPRFIGNPANLETMLSLRGYSEAHCPAGQPYPPGTVFLWNLFGRLAHSSVMTADNRQIEMGHNPGGKKYASQLLPAGTAPKPTGNRTYQLQKALCPPPTSMAPNLTFNATGAATMDGTDRNYGERGADEWNCHGFAATVVTRYARTGISIKPGTRFRWEGSKLVVAEGEVHVKDNEAITVQLPSGTVQPHSEVLLTVQPNGETAVVVLEGEVVFSGLDQTLVLRGGETAVVTADGMVSGPNTAAAAPPEPWWVGDEMIQLSQPEPSTADALAVEFGEEPAQDLVIDSEADNAPSLLTSRNGVFAAAAALTTCTFLLIAGTFGLWRFRRRSNPPDAAADILNRRQPAQVSASFAALERRYEALQTSYHAGQLDLPDFQREAQKLMFQDPQGNWWGLGGEGGSWHWYDGRQWLRRQPPN